jgi:transcriptional regulator with XRE-family HTH domain
MTNKKTAERFVVTKNLAKNLILHRMWHGYSQKELASVVGVTFQQYQKWENCSNNIFADQLIRLCQEKKWDISTIVNGHPEITLIEWNNSEKPKQRSGLINTPSNIRNKFDELEDKAPKNYFRTSPNNL